MGKDTQKNSQPVLVSFDDLFGSVDGIKPLLDHADKLASHDLRQSFFTLSRKKDYLAKGELKGLELKAALLEFKRKKYPIEQLVLFLNERRYTYKGIEYTLFSRRDPWGWKSETKSIAEAVSMKRIK